MNQFYVSLIFIGIVMVSFSLILILLDKNKAFSFIRNYEKKKQELVEIINDAEQMIEELNKFSDYVVTQMDFKNEELSINLKKAHEEIKALTQRTQGNSKVTEEVKAVYKAEIKEETKPEANMQIRENVAVNGNYNAPAKLQEPMPKLNSNVETENQNSEKSGLNRANAYKNQAGRSDKIIPINNKYNEVLRLSKSGMAEVDIARRLNMGKGEIQLILELNK